MPSRNEVQANRIIDLLHAAHRKLHTRIMRTAKTSYTVPQMLLLHELFHHPGISLNELSQRLSLSNSTVSGIVNRLVGQKVVIRVIPEENRRKVSLFLADEVREMGDILMHEKTRCLQKRIPREDSGRVNTLIESLEYLNEILGGGDTENSE